jgi:hypothetical protein
VAGTGRLVRIEGTMNEEKYRQILDENLLLSAKCLRLGAKILRSSRTMNPSIKPKPFWNGFRTRMSKPLSPIEKSH